VVRAPVPSPRPSSIGAFLWIPRGVQILDERMQGAEPCPSRVRVASRGLVIRFGV